MMGANLPKCVFVRDLKDTRTDGSTCGKLRPEHKLTDIGKHFCYDLGTQLWQTCQHTNSACDH